TINACNTYDDLGARAVAIVAPFYFPLGSDALRQHYAEIARNVSIGITLYNIPAFASPISVDVVASLANDHENIIGIKDSSGDVVHMMRMIAEVRPFRPDFVFLTGWDAALVPMLIAGANGGTNATSCVLPELTAAIYRSFHGGNLKEAMRLQYLLLPLFDEMVGLAEFPEGFRAGTRCRGLDLGVGRIPVEESHRETTQRTQDRIQQHIETALRELNHSDDSTASGASNK
ncbi:MAG: dihydrodipicolinate synthase family protein, partial [Planctomycetota bacterium]